MSILKPCEAKCLIFLLCSGTLTGFFKTNYIIKTERNRTHRLNILTFNNIKNKAMKINYRKTRYLYINP